MKSETILELSVKGIAFCEDSGTLDDYLDFKLKYPEYRSIVSSILFIYFRKKNTIESLIKTFVKKTPDKFLKRVLSVVFVQLLYQSGIQDHTATDIAVSYVKSKKGKFAANFINAVIRNFLRDLDRGRSIIEKLESICPIPDLLLKRWQKNYSSSVVEMISKAINSKPPFTFRTTSLMNENESQRLKTKKLSIPWSNEFYTAEEVELLLNSHLMQEGKIYIQDPAAAFFAAKFQNINPVKILDYCSAPGGKTIILSSLFPQSKIVATDRSLNRLKRTSENILRMGINNVDIMTLEDFEKNYASDKFDLVLLDVPCSNTGVIRHRPDVMWKFNLQELKKIAELQSQILEKIYPYTEKGGCLLYSTCSIEPEENKEQIETFISLHPQFEILSQETLLPSLYCDGAFVSLLKLKNE